MYIVQNSTIICLTDCREEDDPNYLPWVRPVTCAAIAISALIFFTLLYFGKSWTESREFERVKRAAVKGSDRRMLRKLRWQESLASQNGSDRRSIRKQDWQDSCASEGVHWNRLKISVLARNQGSLTPETPRGNHTPRASELEMAMFDTKT